MSPEARALLQARRRRVQRIRKRVVATSVATFALVWSVIFFQLVAGDDPGLAKSTTAAGASTSQHAKTSSSSSSIPSTSSSDSSGSSDTTSSSPAPVTTSQS